MKRKIKGGAVSIVHDLLQIDLSQGQTINTSPGSLVYMKGDVLKGEVNIGSLGKAFARSFGNESFFLTKYQGGPKGGTVALSLAFPGDIIQIVLKPKQSYKISQGCFLASTGNITISATPIWKGVIDIGQGEGFIIPVVTNEGPDNGIIWLGGYGSFEKHDLPSESDVLIVDNGIFLACPYHVHYEVEELGKSLWSSFAGGEGFGMKFRGGPGVAVYTQSKSFNDFLMLMSREPPATITNSFMNKVQNNIGEGLVNAVSGLISKGGKKQKPRRLKTTP